MTQINTGLLRDALRLFRVVVPHAASLVNA
jgi:hypothetical protein